ncbi:MerR family transcriptional regulator [Aneurinibacillus sp. Ricciae_BoGa-3]|uniref:MerR family transcriptional regulator n=1 Tax=Aneurinibacillus sp. Ricciae_BoGa-3 TaxID=3022697 RepID=UPI0023420548|nr:MerR family transcriptional regulator [Aneurinibacillus sp. Ricciae_BoGa-3]WCK55931.1 MerR family transcriptional regulator [Aneurinibacillus sp. Ricciae_BoGa-3]
MINPLFVVVLSHETITSYCLHKTLYGKIIIKEGRESIGKFYRIGELAQQAHVSRRTIDYYTNMGLLDADRTHSNYRLYPEGTLDRLRLIECYKKEKLTLEEIKERLCSVSEEENSNGNEEELLSVLKEIKGDMEHLEQKVIEIRANLPTAGDEEARRMIRQMSLQGVSLLHAIMLLLGEGPL